MNAYRQFVSLYAPRDAIPAIIFGPRSERRPQMAQAVQKAATHSSCEAVLLVGRATAETRQSASVRPLPSVRRCGVTPGTRLGGYFRPPRSAGHVGDDPSNRND